MTLMKRSDKPHEPTFWEYPPLAGSLALAILLFWGAFSLIAGFLASRGF